MPYWGVSLRAGRGLKLGMHFHCSFRLVAAFLMTFVGTLVAALVMALSPAHASEPCDEFVARLPNVKRTLCEAAKLQPSAARSVAGRPLWLRDILADNATLRVLVIGAIHGD